MIYIFNDGSCGTPPDELTGDVGAWASVVVITDLTGRTIQRQILTGVEPNSTVNRCELLPIIAGLRWVGRFLHKSEYQTPKHIQVYSDSDYTVKTANAEYARNKNPDLWAAFDRVHRKIPCPKVFTHVGRNSLPYMTVCDGLAYTLREESMVAMTKMFGGSIKDTTACCAMYPINLEDLPC